MIDNGFTRGEKTVSEKGTEKRLVTKYIFWGLNAVAFIVGAYILYRLKKSPINSPVLQGYIIGCFVAPCLFSLLFAGIVSLIRRQKTISYGLAITVLLLVHSTTIKRLNEEFKNNYKLANDNQIKLGKFSGSWKEFVSKEEKFSILLPGIPNKKVSIAKTQVGDIKNITYSLPIRDGAFTIGYIKYPQKLPFDAIDNSINAVITQMKGTLLNKKDIFLAGYPGKEFKIESSYKKATLNARIFIVESILYQVVVITSYEESTNPGIEKVLGSFKILVDNRVVK